MKDGHEATKIGSPRRSASRIKRTAAATPTTGNNARVTGVLGTLRLAAEVAENPK